MLQKSRFGPGCFAAVASLALRSHFEENPASVRSLQIWAKPQANGAMAVLAINTLSTGDAISFNVTLKELNITSSSASVRDVWAHKDLATATGVVPMSVAPQDSVFVVVAPQ